LTQSKPRPDQAEKFKRAAREAECDADEKRWEERLKKVAKQKSGPDARQ
jgi:hypothetical protein